MTRRSQSVIPYILFCIWPITLLPKVLQLGVLFAIGALMIAWSYKTMGKYVIQAPEIALFIYFCIYFLSVAINLSHSDTERILATFNTLTLWVISITLYFLYKNSSFNISSISIIAYINIIVMIFLSLVYYLRSDLQVSFLNRSLVGRDWIDGEESNRFFAFFEYPNLVAAFCLILFPISLRIVSKAKSRIYVYSYCFSILIPISACASRMGLILGIVLVTTSILYVHSQATKKILSTQIIIAFLTFLVVAITFIYRDVLVNVLENIFFSRSGSNSARFNLYEVSLTQMLDRNILLGCGIKEISPMFGDAVPLGSHSTYLGVLYKTGILGFLCFMAALALIIKNILHNAANSLFSVSCTFIILLFFTLEDIDGANWLLALLLGTAGALSNKQESREQELL